MLLAAPTIVGTLSTCSRFVRLQGQFTGATVAIQPDGGAPIPLGVAAWPDETYPLPAGVSLAAGATIRARQLRNADASLWSSDPNAVKVQAVVSQPPPFIDTPFVGCGAVMVVEGLVDGATVTVTDSGGALVGKGGGAGGRADLELSRAVHIDEVVRVAVDACGQSATITSPPAEPFPKAIAQVLKPPLVDPLHACQRIIVARELPIGGWLVMERNNVEHSWRSFNGEIWARVDPPLVANEGILLWARANAPCFVQETTHVTYVVSPKPLDPPSIGSDLCRGTKRIVISNLVPSAEVHITPALSDDPLLAFIAAETVESVDLAGLDVVGGDSITVRQGLCGVFSDRAPVPADVLLPVDHIDPTFVFTPVPCARAVEIAGLTAGCTVQLLSTKLGGLIGVGAVADDRAAIYVSPPLLDGDTITAVIDGCASATIQATVTQQTLRGPVIIRAVEGELGVRIGDVTPGSTVDLKDGKWTLVSSIITRREATMRLKLPLDRTVLHTHARLCDQAKDGPSVDVKPWHVPVFSPVSDWGKNEGKWFAGRVQAILPLAGGTVIAGTEAAGIWLVPPPTPAGAVPAEPLSMTWPDAHVHCVSAGIHGPLHVYVGTDGGLWETDTTAADPLHTWHQVAGVSSAVQCLLVIAGRNTVVIATSDGIHSSVIPAPGGAYAWTTAAPVDHQSWISLASGANQSAVAYRPPNTAAKPKVPAALFVGRWVGAQLVWDDHTPKGPAGSDMATIASRMTNGALASCAAHPERVYLALADTDNGGGTSWLAVLRSDNGGVDWTKPYPQDLAFFAPLGLQAERNLAIAVHPTNPDMVLLGARRTGLLGSIHGGADWDYDRWNERTGDYHGDVLCVLFDAADPAGNRVWSGSDGGLFVSNDQGVSWDSSRNSRFPTLMFGVDGTPSTEALGVNPSSANPHVIVGALQDNGIAVANGLGVRWSQVYGGDGQRTVWVAPDTLFVSVNDDEKGDPGTRGLRWRIWTGGGFGDEHFTRPAGYTPTLNFIPILEVIPSPSISRDGGLLVALAADDRAADGIFGLIDTAPGTASDAGDRFKWVRFTAFADQGRAIGSFSGRHILVSGSDWVKGDVLHLYLLDAVNAPRARTLPAAASGVVRFPQFLGETTAVALCDSGVLYSPDLRLWQMTPAQPDAGALPLVLVVDRDPDPAHLFVGTDRGIWISRNLGASWEGCQGMPRMPILRHLSAVKYATGRFAYAATWNWSAWKAELI